ncbi:MAG: divalent-cation tolerance protein CutA [Xanthomonadales bacterium]|nr:divalent-cation tolerance protein CutA [Xanthomonadales bacterium]
MPADSEFQACVALCACPDGDTAERMAKGLVEARLAACVNIVSGVRSLYRWQGKVQDDAETLMVIKSTAPRIEALTAWLRANHPYEVPEVVCLPVVGGSAEYLDWVASETG